jgi:2-methylaconitate cis-trans-isomerase PrpF
MSSRGLIVQDIPMTRTASHTKRLIAIAAGAFALGAGLSAAGCTPTVRVEVAPINIYARLDADVRVRLDQEVQSLIQQNPNLF